MFRDWRRGTIRRIGFFWLASRLDKIGVWSQAGSMARLDFITSFAPAIDLPKEPGL
jgi:hypothetical protein